MAFAQPLAASFRYDAKHVLIKCVRRRTVRDHDIHKILSICIESSSIAFRCIWTYCIPPKVLQMGQSSAPFNPEVSWFVSYEAHDPETSKQCIFFTQKRTRCKNPCKGDNNKRAISIRNAMKSDLGKAIKLELFEEYIRCCCCCGRARHRDRIEDTGHLEQLALRWRAELQPQVKSNNLTARSPLSEFRPHIAQPDPTDSVYYKLCDRLRARDFETGSLYIFDRIESLGYVKIGWTASRTGITGADRVRTRLEDWSKCGYRSNLLFSVHDVPHAQRAETLTHYDLIKEWRRERRCKAPHCGKSHREWFETTKEHAQETLHSWTEFLIKAKPYDLHGYLQPVWKSRIEQILQKEGVITGMRLLKCYEQSMSQDTKLKGHPPLHRAQAHVARDTEESTASVPKNEPCMEAIVLRKSTLLKNTNCRFEKTPQTHPIGKDASKPEPCNVRQAVTKLENQKVPSKPPPHISKLQTRPSEAKVDMSHPADSTSELDKNDSNRTSTHGHATASTHSSIAYWPHYLDLSTVRAASVQQHSLTGKPRSVRSYAELRPLSSSTRPLVAQAA